MQRIQNSDVLSFALPLLAVVMGLPLAQAQSYTVLYSFTYVGTGSRPLGGVIPDSAGNLYGTASFGGGCCGVVFQLDPSGTATTLYTFTGGLDGSWPQGDLIRDAAGNLYGTTKLGGRRCPVSGCGTVFELESTGKMKAYGFAGGATGETPTAGLIRDSSGNLYGATSGGGTCSSSFCGTIFKI